MPENKQTGRVAEAARDAADETARTARVATDEELKTGQQAASAVADAPAPVLVAVNPENAERVLLLEPIGGGEPITLVLPPARAASVALERDTAYRVTDAEGVRIGVTFAATGRLAGYTVRSPREADGAIVVRP